MSWDHDDPLGVTDHHIPRVDRHIATADRQLHISGMVNDRASRCRWPLVIGGQGEPRDLRRVAKAAVGDHACDPAHHQSGQKDAPG